MRRCSSRARTPSRLRVSWMAWSRSSGVSKSLKYLHSQGNRRAGWVGKDSGDFSTVPMNSIFFQHSAPVKRVGYDPRSKERRQVAALMLATTSKRTDIDRATGRGKSRQLGPLLDEQYRLVG